MRTPAAVPTHNIPHTAYKHPSEQLHNLNMKTVLITGGNRGLGLSLINIFSKAGWQVYGTARNVDSLPSQLDHFVKFPLDLSNHDSVVALADDLLQRKTTIDVVIHNAGFNPKDQKNREGYFDSTFYVEKFSAANVGESMTINALHPMELTGRIHPVLAEDAVVIAISSWLGSIGAKTVPGHYGYTGSKALMNMMIKGMSLEFAKSSRVAITMNPGWMKTDMGGENADISSDQVAERILRMIEDGFIRNCNGKFLNTDRTEHEW